MSFESFREIVSEIVAMTTLQKCFHGTIKQYVGFFLPTMVQLLRYNAIQYNSQYSTLLVMHHHTNSYKSTTS